METRHVPSNLDLHPRYYAFMRAETEKKLAEQNDPLYQKRVEMILSRIQNQSKNN